MRWRREQIKAMARQVAGCRWSEHSSRETIHVNLLALYQKTVLRNIVTQEPQTSFRTDNMQMKPVASAFEPWFNKEIIKMKLGPSLAMCAQAGLYGFAAMKVGLADPGRAALRGWADRAGYPFAAPVSYDDWVWDYHATCPEECAFMGHRFRVPLEAVKGSTHYNKYRKELAASEEQRFNVEGDERLYVEGRGYYGSDEEVEDMVDLWEFWIPQHNVIITLPHDGMTGVTATSHGGAPTPLCEQQWVGDDSGPYEILSYENVIGNLEPKGPIMDLLDLHLPINRDVRKLFRESGNYKSVTVLRKGNDGDTERVRESIDQGLLPLDDPQGVQRLEMNGPSALMLQFVMQMKELFSWFSGNLDVMGGLSPQGRTATQEKLLNANSSGGIQDMQLKFGTFTTNVVKKIAWLHYHHPHLVMESTYEPAGLPEYAQPRELHPWHQAGAAPSTGWRLGRPGHRHRHVLDDPHDASATGAGAHAVHHANLRADGPTGAAVRHDAQLQEIRRKVREVHEPGRPRRDPEYRRTDAAGNARRRGRRIGRRAAVAAGNNARSGKYPHAHGAWG